MWRSRRFQGRTCRGWNPTQGGAAGTALAAVLTKSLGWATLRDLTEKHAVRYKKARLQDFKTLLTGQEIVRETTRKSKPDTVVRNFVRWTLVGDNVVIPQPAKYREQFVMGQFRPGKIGFHFSGGISELPVF